MSEVERLSDHENRYKKYITSFKFSTEDDVNHKVNRVSVKVLILCMHLLVCSISTNYLIAVFVDNEVQDFPIYCIDYMGGGAFWVSLVIIGFIVSSFRILLKKLYIYAYLSPVCNQDRKERMLQVADKIPELYSLLMKRHSDQGFVSEMDYQLLGIDTIHKKLFK